MGKIAFLLQLILIGIISISIIGCDGQTGYRIETSEPGYQILTVKNKLVSFSLDYSTYYEIERPYMDEDNIHPGTFVNLVAPRKEIKMMVPDFNDGGNVKTVSASYCPAAIHLYIYMPLPGESNAQDHIERWVSDIYEEGYSASLERSSVVVSGINAEMLDFIRDSGMLLAVDKKTEYHRVIYFDYGGYIWSFRANSEEELVEQVKADFDHVIETFKIIYVNQP